MSGRFGGKVAFVTGATSGIGRATALALARERASVVVADVAADGNRETAHLIEQADGRALAVSCDVTRGDDIEAALDAAMQRFGRLCRHQARPHRPHRIDRAGLRRREHPHQRDLPGHRRHRDDEPVHRRHR
jgi:NAD(P)-dependent dehydrogenase (short-subunit alcohol dehydrogenase family)